MQAIWYSSPVEGSFDPSRGHGPQVETTAHTALIVTTTCSMWTWGSIPPSGLPRHAPPTARLAFQGLDSRGRISYTHLGWKSGLKPSGTCMSLMSSTFSEEGASVEIGILYSYSAEHNLYVFLPCRQTNKNLKEIPLTPNRQSVRTRHKCCCGRACVIYSCSRWRHSTAKAERMAVCMCEDHHRLLPMTLSSSTERRAGPMKCCSRQRKPTLVLHLSLSMAEREALL